ncbi:MAG: hypothetical protein AAGC85_18680 [Bacteroidota bacterium]
MNPFTNRPMSLGYRGRRFLSITLCFFFLGLASIQQSQAQIIIQIEPPRTDSTNSVIAPADLPLKASVNSQTRVYSVQQPVATTRRSSAVKSQRVARRNTQLLFWEKWLLGWFN